MRLRLAAAFVCAGIGSIASAQLRLVTWNVSNYGGGRTADIQTAVFGTFAGRSMNPDVIVTQEFQSAAAVSSFVAALNTAPGSSGTWAAGPFTNGPDTDNAFFYRSDRVDFVQMTIVGPGGGAPTPPRDTHRYDFRLKGYAGLGPKMAVYSAHMKSGSDSEDETRRLAEATRIRVDAQALPADFAGFSVVGDFNTPSASDIGFSKLVQSETNNLGRFFDPINSLGSWDNNSAWQFVHTQDPSGLGGMDSRFDFVLLSSSLLDGVGFDYIGNPAIPYSSSTWDDPNHSYRAWGNDGSSYNNSLSVGSNSMVGPTIAQSLINAATTAGGHLPVFLDLRVPAEIAAAPGTINLGNVVQGTTPSAAVSVSNGVDTVVWRSGIANLTYSLSTSGGFSAPAGSFVDAAGGGSNSHSIGLNTATLGLRSGTLTVASTDSWVAPVTVSLSANVIPEFIAPSSMNVLSGTVTGGGIAQLGLSDDQKMTWQNGNWYAGGRFSPVFQGVFEATSSLASPGSMTFEIESQGNGQFGQEVEAFDFLAQAYVLVDSRPTSPTDSTASLNLSNPGRFVEAGTRRMRARVTVTPTSWSQPRILSGSFDRLVWKPR